MKSKAQHDAVHYEVGADTIQQAGDNPVSYQEVKFATCQEENGANHKSVKEMYQPTEGGAGYSTFVGIRAQYCRSDRLKHPQRTTAGPNRRVDDRSQDVQNPGAQTAPKNRPVVA